MDKDQATYMAMWFDYEHELAAWWAAFHAMSNFGDTEARREVRRHIIRWEKECDSIRSVINNQNND